MFPNPLDAFLTKLGCDRDDKNTVANFMLLFGISGIVVMLMGYTSWPYMMMCCVGTSIVVLTQHYYKKYQNMSVDPLLSLPPK